MATWKKISLALLLALVLGAGLFILRSRMAVPPPSATLPPPPAGPHAIIVQGRAYCSVSSPVTTPVGGEVLEVLVSVGQAVKKDEVLLRIKIAPNERALLSAKVNTYNTQSSLDASLHEMEAKKIMLQRNISEAQQLVSMNLAPRNALVELQEKAEVIDRQISTTKTALSELRANRENELAGLSKLYGQTVRPGMVPETVIVRAPMDGFVIWMSPTARSGAVITTTTSPLCTVGLMDPMVIRGQVHESETGRLRPGETAEITLDAGKGETFNATLSNVSWAPLDNAVSAASYYLFELTVTNPDLKIKDGNKVQVSFPPQQGDAATERENPAPGQAKAAAPTPAPNGAAPAPGRMPVSPTSGPVQPPQAPPGQ
ncbi:MAG TPA: HlyD family efflux transporter periplasmic adaptor subunit [Humidesulfovibrio sp.]|uniref:efflux RND transporter periplasmic adaptor subunit n=1 Tax=Humidesulfovibrio sp. TaxID=2910988 RepID=UPI002CC6ECB3|nr:HlyD family efflux transporter periplasmic adaptor subunit [Humidesulfovibrio sp.]HWR04156.1 HlyD family efflux transporter periplasmic adaptor subunit [Humidesulfovibrio sp.]